MIGNKNQHDFQANLFFQGEKTALKSGDLFILCANPQDPRYKSSPFQSDMKRNTEFLLGTLSWKREGVNGQFQIRGELREEIGPLSPISLNFISFITLFIDLLGFKTEQSYSPYYVTVKIL